MDDTVIASGPEVLIRSGRLASICLLGAWTGQRAALAAHLRSVLGANLPTNGHCVAEFDGGTVFGVNPDKLLVISARDPQVAKKLKISWPADTGSLSDQSHSRVALALSGKGLWSVLRQGLPLDPEHAMPEVGHFVQTRLGDANVLVHRHATQSAMVLVPTSFAQSVSEWMVRAHNNITK